MLLADMTSRTDAGFREQAPGQINFCINGVFATVLLLYTLDVFPAQWGRFRSLSTHIGG